MKEVHVEIDIEQEIEFGKNAEASDNRSFSIQFDSENETVIFKGKIEDQDNDGMAYLRISSDCLLMVESKHSNLKDKFIELSVSIADIEITPIG